MKTFVIPTDFSANAQKALDYAVQMTNGKRSTIHLLYCYYPSQFHVQDAILVEESQQEVKEALLNNIVKNWKDTYGTSADHITLLPVLRIGFPAGEILQYCRERKVDFIVMGTTGEGDMVKKILGSVSTQVFEGCNDPLILIPPKYKLSELKSILIASSQDGDKSSIEYGIALGADHDADVHVLHVDPESEYQEGTPYEQYSGDRIRYVSLTDEDIADTIEEYAEDEQMDLVIMTTQHRSFMQKLFHKSVSREVASELNIPVLILKENE